MSSNFFQIGLHGDNPHVDPLSVFEDLHWEEAGKKPEGCPHSVWQILNHMVFWQDFILDYLNDMIPDSPRHAKDSWPGDIAPSNETEWINAVHEFGEGLKKSEDEAEKDFDEKDFGGSGETRGDLLATLINHNSYHAGQVVLIRRICGHWPPPSGGDTW